MSLIEFVFDALSYPSLWIGIALGILVASIAWYLLPETFDRASFAGWAVAIGFIGGLVFSFPSKDQK
ncbi:MAG: hypothetical protein IPM27_01005 [Nitrosomonadales bacterium]|nr:hypothetical protein [Nitrosomonadales bacterium]